VSALQSRRRFFASVIGGLFALICGLSTPTAGQTISPGKLLGRYQQFVWQDQLGDDESGSELSLNDGGRVPAIADSVLKITRRATESLRSRAAYCIFVHHQSNGPICFKA
jgi:hypothetical protein